MAVQYVEIVQRSAWLNTEFGLELACKKLNKTPAEIEALVGRNSKGKRKGQLKGQLVWFAVIQGGWVKTGAYDHEMMQANGFVQRLKVSYAYAIIDPYKFEGNSNNPLVLAHDAAYHPDSRQALENFNNLNRKGA